VYCKGNHTAINCETHKDIQSRKDIIKQQRLCYNCLAHHHVSQCSSKNRCHKCGNKHHTSICSDNPVTPASSSVHAAENTVQGLEPNTIPPVTADPINTASLTTLAPARHSTCLLKTAIATVAGGNLHMQLKPTSCLMKVHSTHVSQSSW